MTELCGYQVRLRPVAQTDLEQLRRWRNTPEIREQMLDPQIISAEQQQAWFNNIQRSKTQRHWIIEYKGQPIGSANIRSAYKGQPIAEADSIEPGIYIGVAQYRANILAFAPSLVLCDYCFNALGCKQLKAVVKASNQAALNYNLKLGYRVLSKGKLVEIGLVESDYQHHTAQLKSLLSRTNKK